MTAIRRIRADDWSQYKILRLEALRLHPEAFGATETSEQSKTDEQWRTRVQAGAHSADQVMLVADTDRQLVGVVGLYREEGKHRHVANVWGMYVQADYRGHDLGRALMQETLMWARRMDGLKKIKLEVTASNEPAHKLYLACGFKESGRLYQEMNVNGQLYDMILMEIFL